MRNGAQKMNREDDPNFKPADVPNDEPAADGSPDLFLWEQQDKHPSITALLKSSYQTQKRLTTLAKSLHRDIITLEQVRGRVNWQGHAWKWAVTYTHPAITRQSPAAFAYLIPDPEQLKLVIPLNQEMIRNFNETTRLNRNEFLAHSIQNAVQPNQYAWPIWPITNKKQSYQLMRLAKWKLTLLTKNQ